MHEVWQNLVGLLGHLSREILDGQFFALIVRIKVDSINVILDELFDRDSLQSPFCLSLNFFGHWFVSPNS